MPSLKPLVVLLTGTMTVALACSIAVEAASADAPAATAASAPIETQTVIVPGHTTDVVPSKPPGTYRAAPGSVEAQSVMTTGVNHGSTRINVGDHATPKLPPAPEAVAPMAPAVVQPPPAPAPVAPVVVAEPPAAAPAPAPIETGPEPVPAPKRDRN
jgi:hypothetical protein